MVRYRQGYRSIRLTLYIEPEADRYTRGQRSYVVKPELRQVKHLASFENEFVEFHVLGEWEFREVQILRVDLACVVKQSVVLVQVLGVVGRCKND